MRLKNDKSVFNPVNHYAHSTKPATTGMSRNIALRWFPADVVVGATSSARPTGSVSFATVFCFHLACCAYGVNQFGLLQRWMHLLALLVQLASLVEQD